MNDSETLCLKKRDKESFANAIFQVKDHAYKIAYCYMRNEHDSLDMVYNAIEKAYKNLNKLKDPSYFKTWFIRIVINECNQCIKRKKKFNSIVYTDVKKEISENISFEEIMDLNDLLSSLCAEDRLFIYMKFYLGYTLNEISSITELPLSTIKNKLYKCLRGMKDKLEIKEVDFNA